MNAVDVVDAAEQPRRGTRCNEAEKTLPRRISRRYSVKAVQGAAAWEESMLDFM